jgi:hypothetical protein
VLSPDQYPVATKSDGSWETVAAGHWMSGLFPGVMWQLYELTGGKKIWAEKAQQWQAGLANKQVCCNRSCGPALASCHQIRQLQQPLQTFSGIRPSNLRKHTFVLDSLPVQ